jgi:hypothetical protein
MKHLMAAGCFALAFAAANAASADLTAKLKAEVRRGQNAALFALKPGQAFPSQAMGVYLRMEKSQAKESDGYKLGFAMSVISHMTTAYQFSLSLPAAELQQAGTGWVIYSSKATMLQIQMHLTDAQMKELFGSEALQYLKKPPGPL